MGSCGGLLECWSSLQWMKGSFPCAFLVGELVLIPVCPYMLNSSLDSPSFLESLERVLESAPTGDSILLLEDPQSCSHGKQWTLDTETLRPPFSAVDAKPTQTQLDLCLEVSFSGAGGQAGA